MISKISPKVFDFLEARFMELIGIILVFLSIFFLISLASYSPTDPNFLYPEKTDIKNLFGFPGSVISDFILQSIGIIGFLLSLNILIWGIKIIISKDSNNILKKIFFSLVYILSGTATINIYIDHSFWLLDNGNGGFVGRVVSDFIFKYINFLENNYITLSLSLITLVFFLQV